MDQVLFECPPSAFCISAAASWFIVRFGPVAIKVWQNGASGDINATSTRECGFRAGFAAECRRMRLNAG